MDFFPRYDKQEFTAFVTQIINKDAVDDWQVIEIGLTGSHNASFIAHKVYEHYKDKDGVTLIVNKTTVLVLVSLGTNANLQLIAIRVRAKMPPNSCTVVASGMTGDGLARIQLHVHEALDQPVDSGDVILTERAGREENVVMIADSDPAARKTIDSAFSDKAHIIVEMQAANILDTYLELLPDIVFLNVNMTGLSGRNIVEEIRNFDKSAFIVIITTDTEMTSVQTALASGAMDALVKPLAVKKLQEAYETSPTVTKNPK